MYNINNKRLLQSPPEKERSNQKLPKISTNSVLNSESDMEQKEEPVLNEKEAFMLKAFTDTMCKELDKRFDSFSDKVISPIRGDIHDMKGDIKSLTSEIEALKLERVDLLSKVDRYDQEIGHLQKESRATNLVFYNIPDNTDIRKCIEDVYKGLLRIEQSIDIVRATVLKADQNKGTLTALIKFSSPSMVGLILKNVHKLKGTNSSVGISRDLTEEERKDRGVLLKLRKKLRENDKQSKVKVVGTSILINTVKLTYRSRTNYFGNSNSDGRAFIRENFSIDFDDFITNSQ